MEVLKQDRNSPVPVEKQVAILYATTHDFLKDVAVKDIAEYEQSLYEFLDANAAAAAVMDTIRTTGKLEKDTEEALRAALTEFGQDFAKTR